MAALKMMATPIKFGPVEIKNRFIVSPMVMNCCNEDGTATEKYIADVYKRQGVCCANMTPAIIKFAAKTYPEKMKKLGNIMGAKITSDDPEVIGTQAADAVRKFAASIGVKTCLLYTSRCV